MKVRRVMSDGKTRQSPSSKAEFTGSKYSKLALRAGLKSVLAQPVSILRKGFNAVFPTAIATKGLKENAP